MKIQQLTTAFLMLVYLGVGRGQWSNDPGENTVVSLFTTLPTLVSDGHNGVIVFSQSRDVNPVIRAQRVSVGGELLWPGLQGVRVSDALHAQWIREPRRNERFVLPDGEGGAYIAYQVGRIIGELPEVGEVYATSAFVQRLDASGNRLFGPEGLRLMPILPDTFEFSQRIMNMISDGEGGIYVLWWAGARDSTQYNGVYVSRIDKDGTAMWPTAKVTERASNTYIPYLDNDGNLNLYEYPGETVPPGGYPDQFLKIDRNSGEVLERRPIEIGAGEYGFSAFYDVVQSGNGSAIFAFYDFRAETLRVQKLDGDGKKLWGQEPLKIAKDLYHPTFFDLESDGADGAYLWYRGVDDAFHLLYLDGWGGIRWERQFPAKVAWNLISVAPDCSVFVLSDNKVRSVTKLSSSGHVLWESIVSTRLDSVAAIDSWDLLADSAGGCTVVWEEVGAFVGLRAQRVDRYGNLGGSTPVTERRPRTLPGDFRLKRPSPNPFNDTVRISFSIPQNTRVSLKVYDILGKEVRTLKDSRLKTGRYSALWDGRDAAGAHLPSGVYVLVLRSGRQWATQKILFLK